MADSASMAEETIPALEEIPVMKVADLRKKLRAFGIPITGNKTELVERLTEFCMSNKGIESFESSHLSFDSSQISELEEGTDSSTMDGALLEQEHFSSYIDSSPEDDPKVLTSSENKLNSSSNSTLLAKPLKKRTIVHSNEESAPPKKMVINRTSIAHTEISMKPTSTTKQEIVVTNDKSDADEKRPTSVKNLSALERMAMRAKRFNMSSSTAVTSITNTKLTNVRNSKQSILSAPVTTDIDVLKKRAERFGQNVSTVLKQIEQKEKLQKRKSKFGANVAASATTGLDDQCSEELPDAEEQVEPNL